MIDAQAPRSPFVSGLAWVLVAFSAFAALILGLQAYVVSAMFDAELLQFVLDGMEPQPVLALDGATVLRLMRFFVYSLLMLCVVSLVASIGLLLRMESARIFWVVMFALGAVLHLIGAVLPFLIAMPVVAPAGAVMAIKVVSAVLALVFGVLYAWLARKLLEPGIAAEFA